MYIPYWRGFLDVGVALFQGKLHEWDLPVGYYFYSFYRFRVGATSLVSH